MTSTAWLHIIHIMLLLVLLIHIMLCQNIKLAIHTCSRTLKHNLLWEQIKDCIYIHVYSTIILEHTLNKARVGVITVMPLVSVVPIDGFSADEVESEEPLDVEDAEDVRVGLRESPSDCVTLICMSLWVADSVGWVTVALGVITTEPNDKIVSSNLCTVLVRVYPDTFV